LRLFAGGTILRLTVFVSLILLASLNAHAFQQDCSVRVPISVRATKGKDTIFLKRVTVENFHVTINKEPVKVRISPHYGGYRFVLLLDHSGSMMNLWQVELRFAEDFLQRLDQDSTVGLIVFNDQSELSVPLQHAAQVLNELKKFANTPPSEKTALFTNLEKAITWLTPPRDGDVIYVITDGGDNRSEMAKSRTEELLQRNGIRIFSLLINDQTPPPIEEERFGPLFLQSLSLESGGDFLRLDSTKFTNTGPIPNYAIELFPEMVYQFTLQLGPEASPRKAKLDIKYESPDLLKAHVKVLHPKQIFNPCISSSTN
jgi:Mg-chelatase subunit ChlD